MWVFFFWGTVLGFRSRGVEVPLFYQTWHSLLALVVMTLILGGGCLLNQIVDVESDRANKKLFFLPLGLVSLRAAWAELCLVWGAAVVLSMPLTLHFKLAAAFALTLNVTYSAPPLRAKSHFPLDMIWNGLGFGMASAMAGWASVARLAPGIVPAGLAYTLAVAGVTASTTILDEQGDREEGLRTTAVVMGEQAASLLAVVLVAAAAACGAVLRDPLALFGSAASIPLLVLAHFTCARRHRIAANQLMVAAFAVVVSLYVPYMLLLLAAVYFGSRTYYRARFGLTYPGAGTP
jgi:4-hydroxybenzoate polyprenyltransferase